MADMSEKQILEYVAKGYGRPILLTPTSSDDEEKKELDDEELRAILAQDDKTEARKEREEKHLSASARALRRTETVEQQKREKEVEREAKQEEKRIAEERATIKGTRRVATQALYSQARSVSDSATRTTGRLVDTMTQLPTPGSVGGLVAILCILLLTIVPANAAGDTRLRLLFYTFLGRTTLQGAVNVPLGT